MSKRVDRETLLCKAHGAIGCTACMIGDLIEAVYAATEKRRLEREAMKTRPVDEHFDLGGES